MDWLRVAVVVTLALGGLVYVYRFGATEKARSDRAAEVSRDLAITTRQKRFEETTFKTYQDAFAGMSEWEVSRAWVYESKPGERLKLEALVMLSRNGPRPDERYAFDVRYEYQGGEWVFQSASGKHIKPGHPDRTLKCPSSASSINDVAIWIKSMAK